MQSTEFYRVVSDVKGREQRSIQRLEFFLLWFVPDKDESEDGSYSSPQVIDWDSGNRTSSLEDLVE